MEVCSATSALPGVAPAQAIAALTHGASEALWGRLSTKHIQICPQNPGHLSEGACEALRERFPNSQLRLHANARVLAQHMRVDLSSFCDETRHYFEALADRSRRLGAQAYTLHAGYHHSCSSLEQLWQNHDAVQSIFGDITVGIEGLYPLEQNPQWVSSWAQHEALLASGRPYALDLSHLKIVAHREGWAWALARELLAAPQCIEVHVSENDGKRDQHQLLSRGPTWESLIPEIEGRWQRGGMVVFSEGDQLGRGPATWKRWREALKAAAIPEFA